MRELGSVHFLLVELSFSKIPNPRVEHVSVENCFFKFLRARRIEACGKKESQ